MPANQHPVQAKVNNLNGKVEELEGLLAKMRDVQLENAALRSKLDDAPAAPPAPPTNQNSQARFCSGWFRAALAN